MRKLFYGGNIVTMERENETIDQLLIEDGIIIAIGTQIDFQAEFSNHAVKKINLNGKTMLPGLIDPHSHISMVGPMSELADLSACTSYEEIIVDLKQYIADKQIPTGECVMGVGYDHNFLEENDHPTKDILNRASTDHPILLVHASNHMGCCNSQALKFGGITNTTPDPDGGKIGRMTGSMEPNGYMEEAALIALQEKMPTTENNDEVVLALKGQDIYLQNGITTAQDGATPHEALTRFYQLGAQGQLKLDVVAYPTVKHNPDDFNYFSECVGQYHNHLKVGGLKLFLDGSPQGKTAWLTEPYEGETTYKGYPWFSDEEVEKLITRAIDENAQLLAHCNGDAASDQLLRCYQNVLAKSNNPYKNALRPVMIHCQTVRKDQLLDMAKLQMIPSIFNAHTYYWGDIHLKNLGNKRGNRISPAKSAFDCGLKVNFHTDSPVVKPNLLHSVWCAVNRITRKGVKLGQDECVSVYQALKGITINAAYAYFEEKEKGSIKVGKLADLVILDKNPLESDPMDIKDIQVLETIKEGKTVYQKEAVGVKG